MMRFDAVIALFPDLELSELTVWIERQWVLPERGEGDLWIFHDIDIARVNLIYDLRRHLDTSEEVMPVLLSLLDQLYELRRQLKTITKAVEDQPPEVRESILALMRDSEPGR
jgi:chaperone modulatory protein CbpM